MKQWRIVTEFLLHDAVFKFVLQRSLLLHITIFNQFIRPT